jgi:hypothetical protein
VTIPAQPGAGIVVAEGDDRVEHGGVEAPVGAVPSVHRVLDEEQGVGVHHHRRARSGVQACDLAVGTEAAPAPLELLQAGPGVLDAVARRVDGVGDHDHVRGGAHDPERELRVGHDQLPPLRACGARDVPDEPDHPPG